MIRTVPRALPRLLAVLAAGLVTVPIAPTAWVAGGPWLTAAAAQPTTPALTWAVQPADQHGPDGRRWIELTLDPGQVMTEHLAVRNLSDRTVVFSLQAADGYLTDKGRFNMLPSNQASVDGGTWIGMQEQVTVGAKETKVVPFTITVPRDATPGDHPAGVAATITSTEGTVAVESRVGFRVMTRVSGTVTAAITVSDVTATYQHSWNPFSAGTIRLRYTTTNDGNVAVTGTGRVTVAGLFGLAQTDTPAEVEETFPGERREVDARIAGVWAWGALRTSVEVTPSVDDALSGAGANRGAGAEATDLAAGGPAGAAIHPASATVTVWTLPWPQLVLAAIFGALVFALRTITRRRRQRLAQLLARARDEGRAEGRTSTLVGSPPKEPGT
jgi:hypothetical protein